MNKLLSCRYNMDTNRVEAHFADGTILAIDCVAIEDEPEATAPITPHNGQNWTGCCIISHWSMRRWC